MCFFRGMSPIDPMIDEACGYDRSAWENNRVAVRCPKCTRSQFAPRDETDPEGTRIVIYLCPECRPDGFDDCPRYLDAEGVEIIPEWAKT